MALKKTVAAGAACALLLAALVVPASAHGHRASQTSGNYPVCTVDGCGEYGYHTHDGTGYCGHSYSGGSYGHHGGRGHHGGHC